MPWRSRRSHHEVNRCDKTCDFTSRSNDHVTVAAYHVNISCHPCWQAPWHDSCISKTTQPGDSKNKLNLKAPLMQRLMAFMNRKHKLRGDWKAQKSERGWGIQRRLKSALIWPMRVTSIATTCHWRCAVVSSWCLWAAIAAYDMFCW